MMAGSPTGWSGWIDLREQLLPGFAVGQNGDGRLEVFGVNRESGEVMHAFQQTAQPDAAWSAWMGMGGQMRPGLLCGRNKDNHLDLFAVGLKNNLIYDAFQITAGTATNWTGWGGMASMGGLFRAEQNSSTAPPSDIRATTLSYPAFGTNPDGPLELFAFDPKPADVLNHRSQIAGGLSWTDWFSLDRATRQYVLRAWRIDEGLPDNRVQAVAQTADGYIWVGTHNGLAKFDGANFLPVGLPGGATADNSSVTCLLTSADGALWIGFDGGGLARVSRSGIQRFAKTNGLAGDHVTTIYEDAKRSLWIGTTTGLSRCRNGQFISDNKLPKFGAVQSVQEDSGGRMWIAADNKLTRITGNNVRTFRDTNELGTMVKCLWLDPPGRLWIGSDRGLVLYRSYKFSPYDKSFGLSDRIVNLVRGDSCGNLWVGTYSGLTRFEEGRFIEDLETEGASFGKINDLFEDREGDIWVGSQNGLFRLTPKRVLSYDRRQGLTQNNVSAVLESEGGSLWIGTSGGGLDQLKDGAVTPYAVGNHSPMEWITALARGRDGSLWMGGDFSGGLARLKNGTMTRLTAADGLVGGAVKVIHEDRSGAVWIGARDGLSCLRDGKISTYKSGVAVRDICEDSEGRLWIGTEAGLSLWQNGAFTEFTTNNGLSDNTVNALYADNENAVWIGTEHGGLNRFHAGRFATFTAEQGLFSNEILAMVEDDFGWLWMTCSKGVFRVLKANLMDIEARRAGAITSIAYGRDDGMESVLCSAGKPAAWKTRDGQLWFATALGLVDMDPRAMSVNQIAPPVCIGQMVVNGKAMLHQDDVFSTDVPAAPVRIPPGRNEVEFHYTALNFQRPERIRFRYKLEGADAGWIEAGTRRTAFYNNLPPGNYNFHVMACNSDGVWNETGAKLAMILPPHLWQTWEFWAGCALASAAAIAGLARYATKRRMERKLQKLQEQHAVELERARIARDMHDELGAKLTRISFQGAMAQRRLPDSSAVGGHIEKMAETARELVNSLDEIVWVVDPKNDSLEELAVYISRYASAFFEDSPIQCKLIIPDHLPACRLTLDVRHSLFLAIKEALNNVLKHSGATSAEVQIRVDGELFEIRITDNGRGIAPSAPVKNGRVGHGLANLNERLAAVQGRCEVRTIPGQGTSICLVIPLERAAV